MAARSSSGRASTARITGAFDFLAQEFMFGCGGFAQTAADVELFGFDRIDVLVGRAAVMRDQVVLGGIDGDAVQPGGELSLAAEAAERAVGAQEGLLRHVLRLAPVGDVARDHRQHAVLMAAHERIERRAVALLDPFDQLHVELRFGGHVPLRRKVFGHAVPALQSGAADGRAMGQRVRGKVQGARRAITDCP